MYNNVSDILILMYKGKSKFSYPIKKLGKTNYSHCSLLILDSFLCFETDIGTNVSLNPIKYNRNDYELYKYRELTDFQKEQMISFMLNKIGEKYSMWDNWRTFLKIRFGIYLPDDKNKTNCIDLLIECFQSCGIDLVPNKQEPYIFEDILENENLECFY